MYWEAVGEVVDGIVGLLASRECDRLADLTAVAYGVVDCRLLRAGNAVTRDGEIPNEPTNDKIAFRVPDKEYLRKICECTGDLAYEGRGSRSYCATKDDQVRSSHLTRVRAKPRLVLPFTEVHWKSE